ncbi:hypothetical protein ACKWTF_013354 [Chironomus riparius]
MRKLVLLMISIILFIAVNNCNGNDKLKSSTVWKLVKRFTIHRIHDLMVQNIDCDYNNCNSKQALIDYVNNLADDDTNQLKSEHCDYLIKEIIEKDFHLLARDEL